MNAFLVFATTCVAASAAGDGTGYITRSDSLPRKVVVASALASFSGTVEERLALAAQLLSQAAAAPEASGAGVGLDLMVFPEFAWLKPEGSTAAEQAIDVDGAVVEALGAMARQYRTWIVAPMILQESAPVSRVSNAAVLLDREGEVAGVFRKVHPIVDAHGQFEGGVAPGNEYPVFECDFGRLGILICWDMGYAEAWQALASAGAEIVALPSASPQTLRPAAEALRHQFYVVTSTPRDNASIFDPIGRRIASATEAPGVVVRKLDLAYAILHWSESLQEGKALRERFGDRVGFDYSAREDTGIFYSNDPQVSIGAMIRELELQEMPVRLEQMRAARDAAVRGQPSPTR